MSIDSPNSQIKKLKVIFVGSQNQLNVDGNTGKTALIEQFINNKFLQQHLATIGIDFFAKNIIVDGISLRIQLWDTAGQERFRPLIPNYAQDTNIFVYLFDLTNLQSLNKYQQWYNLVKGSVPKDTVKILVGNKSDLKQDRKVTQKQIKRFRNNYKFDHYTETSAKNNQSVLNFINDSCRLAMLQKSSISNQGSKQIKQSKPKDNIPEKQRNSILSFFDKFLNHPSSNKKQQSPNEKSVQNQVKISEDFPLEEHLLRKQEVSNESEIVEISQHKVEQDNQFKNLGISEKAISFLIQEKINLQILMMMNRDQIKQLNIPIGDQYRIISALNKK